MTLIELVSFVSPGAAVATLLEVILPNSVAHPVDQVRALGIALLEARSDRRGLEELAVALDRAESLVALKRSGDDAVIRAAIGCGQTVLGLAFGTLDQVEIRETVTAGASAALFGGIEPNDDFTVAWQRIGSSSATLRLVGGSLLSGDGEHAALGDEDDRADAIGLIRGAVERILDNRAAPQTTAMA